jgi:hypothetical protein
MRARHLLALLGAAAAAAVAIPSTASAQAPAAGVIGHMRCVAPTDAAGLDAILAEAGSPLAGEGATFVSAGAAAGVDPRALVAIAAHETLLETYGPAQAIRNPFGLGPGWAFASERDAIERAAVTLAGYYVPEGRVTLAAIGAKWAPLGAANDPTGLNGNWTAGVGSYYAALGGDPARSVLAADQDAVPACGGSQALAVATGEVAAAGPPVVTAWGGAVPQTPRLGADPRGGGAVTLAGFVFPLALPVGAPASYRDSFGDPGPLDCGAAGRQCGVVISSAPGADTVAAAAGILRAASAAEQEQGVAFWIEVPGGDRLGYGPLAGYAGGIAAGAAVTAGQPLGTSAGTLRIAWERDGVRVDPYPLLAATRPSAG